MLEVRRLVRAAIENPAERREALRALERLETADALLGLVEVFEATPEAGALDSGLALRNSVEIFALAPEPRDPRPQDALEALARNGPSPTHRFLGLYLLEELALPTFAPIVAPGAKVLTLEFEPVWFPDEHPGHSLVRSLTQVPFYPVRESEGVRMVPWPPARNTNGLAVCDIVQALERKVVVVPPPLLLNTRFDTHARHPLKALRALAALNGCVVRERGPGTLEVAAR